MNTGPICTWQISPSLIFSAETGSIVASAVNAAFSSFLSNEQNATTSHSSLAKITAEPGQPTGWQLLLNGMPFMLARTDNEVAPMLETAITNLAVQTRKRSLVFHAGAVRCNDTTMMLIGESGSGKSTMTLWLAVNGGCYYGDELIFYDLDDNVMRAFPKAVTLKQGSFSYFKTGEVFFSRRRKEICYCLPDNAASGYEALSDIDMLILPQYTAGEFLEVIPLKPYETMLMLAQQGLGGFHRDHDAFEAAVSLAKKPGYIVRFSDLEVAGKAIKELCQSNVKV